MLDLCGKLLQPQLGPLFKQALLELLLLFSDRAHLFWAQWLIVIIIAQLSLRTFHGTRSSRHFLPIRTVFDLDDLLLLLFGPLMYLYLFHFLFLLTKSYSTLQGSALHLLEPFHVGLGAIERLVRFPLFLFLMPLLVLELFAALLFSLGGTLPLLVLLAFELHLDFTLFFLFFFFTFLLFNLLDALAALLYAKLFVRVTAALAGDVVACSPQYLILYLFLLILLKFVLLQSFHQLAVVDGVPVDERNAHACHALIIVLLRTPSLYLTLRIRVHVW